MAEPGNLADGDGEVWANIGGELKKHTHDRFLASCFGQHGKSVWVDSKCGLSSWSPIVITVGHASCFLDISG